MLHCENCISVPSHAILACEFSTVHAAWREFAFMKLILCFVAKLTSASESRSQYSLIHFMRYTDWV